MDKLGCFNNIRLPEWLRQDIPVERVLALFSSFKNRGVNTVCQEARCPNLSRCLTVKNLAFMILGNQCTRSCRFCSVAKCQNKTLTLDKQEPYRILEVIKDLQLSFVIITSVTRDDLGDCGAGQFARTIRVIREYNRDIKVEVLIPDFPGAALNQVVSAQPDVLAHNVETVPCLYPVIRPEANYQRSLKVIAQTKRFNPNLITKSSLLLGMGERRKDVFAVMDDLIQANCDILVLGQYLAPSLKHYPVKEFVSIQKFQSYKNRAVNLGFKQIVAHPLARTSYKAEEVYSKVRERAFSNA